MSVFLDQAAFMKACDQTVGTKNDQQFRLYLDLIREELGELEEACRNDDDLGRLDALIDIMVVTVGALHSLGANSEGAWNEVMNTNFAKIDRVTGKVIKRADGKVLKPEGWRPPDLGKFLR